MKKHALNLSAKSRLKFHSITGQQFLCLPLILAILFMGGCKKDFKNSIPASATGENGLAKTVATQPNILFILADDVGYEIPTADGGQSYSTPNIDKLANNGMRFTQCHASPLCAHALCF